MCEMRDTHPFLTSAHSASPSLTEVCVLMRYGVGEGESEVEADFTYILFSATLHPPPGTAPRHAAYLGRTLGGQNPRGGEKRFLSFLHR